MIIFFSSKVTWNSHVHFLIKLDVFTNMLVSFCRLINGINFAYQEFKNQINALSCKATLELFSKNIKKQVQIFAYS